MWTAPTAMGPISSSSRIATLMSTMSPSPAFWRSRPCLSTSSAPSKRTALALILESAEPPRCTISPPCWVTVPAPSTPTWPTRPSASSSTTACWTKTTTPLCSDYDKAVLSGIVKIASKMGISTIQSYAGSQIFEALGISKEVIDKYFTDTVLRVGGIDDPGHSADVEARHHAAFDPLGLDINSELRGLVPTSSAAARCRAASLQPADHPPVPASLLDRRLRHVQAVTPSPLDSMGNGARAPAQPAGLQL